MALQKYNAVKITTTINLRRFTKERYKKKLVLPHPTALMHEESSAFPPGRMGLRCHGMVCSLQTETPDWLTGLIFVNSSVFAQHFCLVHWDCIPQCYVPGSSNLSGN